MEQIAVFQDDEKQREMELLDLKEENKRLKLQLLDESKYMEWGSDEIAAWFINLDPDRMKQYEKAVSRALKEDEVNGSFLAEVDGGELRQWGIQKIGDRKFVQKEIARLVAAQKVPKGGPKVAKGDLSVIADEGANAAPTAYM